MKSSMATDAPCCRKFTRINGVHNNTNLIVYRLDAFNKDIFCIIVYCYHGIGKPYRKLLSKLQQFNTERII